MNPRFEKALLRMPAELVAALDPVLTDEFAGFISAVQVQAITEMSGLNGSDLRLALLPLAATFAHVPISDFYVGAIAQGESGNFYMGANLELTGKALFHSVHAEQSAISHAWLSGEQKITGVTVNAPPCGHCRQFMTELNNNDGLIIEIPEQKPQSLSYFLPNAFGPQDLGIEGGLLNGTGYGLDMESDDPLVKRALQEASASYSPYSLTPAAIVLEAGDDQIFVGRYAENAAFNPSLPPMQMALSCMTRAGVPFRNISRAVLVESGRGHISFVRSSKNVLETIGKVQLETFKA